MNYYILFSILCLTIITNPSKGQHNNFELSTSINTTGTAPDNSAILDINAPDKGILVPRMTEIARNAIPNPTQGLLIYQMNNTAGFYYFNGTSWTPIAGQSTASNTLDNAYNQGGSGAGRFIFTPAGPVEIRNTVVDGTALKVETNTGTAILGETDYNAGTAILAQNYDNIGAFNNGAAVAGVGRFGVIGQDRYNGAVTGAYGVFSSGDLGASGTKTFMIDHPLDPENKILRHFSIESNEVLNIYRGNATFDANGEAIIQLPEYFDAINQNPSYQLTPIGGAANLYIKTEIENNTFVIAGGRIGMKVSWTVHTERNDAYLQQFPEKRAVEMDKNGAQKGKFIMPNLFDSTNHFFYETKTQK